MRLRAYLTRVVWLVALPLLLFDAGLGAVRAIEARREIDREAADMAREAARTVDRMLRTRIHGLAAGRLAGARLERALRWLVTPATGQTGGPAARRPASTNCAGSPS